MPSVPRSTSSLVFTGYSLYLKQDVCIKNMTYASLYVLLHSDDFDRSISLSVFNKSFAEHDLPFRVIWLTSSEFIQISLPFLPFSQSVWELWEPTLQPFAAFRLCQVCSFCPSCCFFSFSYSDTSAERDLIKPFSLSFPFSLPLFPFLPHCNKMEQIRESIQCNHDK